MKTYKSVLMISATIALTAAAFAQVSLNSARVGAKDTAALAKFYQAAFGMAETNRINGQGGPEIFLNFGKTADEAKANKAEPVVLMHRDSDDLKDPIPHLIFNVKDMTATVAAIKANGGSMAREPFAYGNSGMKIGIAVDPVGNQIELIQQAAAK